MEKETCPQSRREAKNLIQNISKISTQNISSAYFEFFLIFEYLLNASGEPPGRVPHQYFSRCIHKFLREKQYLDCFASRRFRSFSSFSVDNEQFLVSILCTLSVNGSAFEAKMVPMRMSENLCGDGNDRLSTRANPNWWCNNGIAADRVQLMRMERNRWWT